MPHPGFLFADGFLSDALRGQERKLGEAAQGIPADHALAASAEDLAAELVAAFRVEPLALDEAAMTIEQADEQLDARYLPDRFVFDRDRPLYVPGTRFTLHVPFSGDAELLRLRSSRGTSVLPSAVVSGSEMLISETAAVPIKGDVKAALLKQLEALRQYVEWSASDVARYNEGLPRAALAAATSRREKVIADHDLIASFGIPVRRADAPRTYAAPPVRRPTPVRAAGTTARRLEPVLPAEEYEHILSIVRQMAQVMEHSPNAFATMDEEDIRQHFLVQLNGQYEGSATGETFNGDGKTDILIRRDGRNTFIAECKFWRGPKKLTEAVDQILGYLSWHDTKSAIFLFNRARALSTVLRQISPTLTAHPACVREVAYGCETDFRFVLRHPDDEERELTLTVLVFEVPG